MAKSKQHQPKRGGRTWESGRNSGAAARARAEREQREKAERDQALADFLPDKADGRVYVKNDSDRIEDRRLEYLSRTGIDVAHDDPNFVVYVPPPRRVGDHGPFETVVALILESAPVLGSAEDEPSTEEPTVAMTDLAPVTPIRPNTLSPARQKYAAEAAQLIATCAPEELTVADMAEFMNVPAENLSPSISIAFLEVHEGWEHIHRTEHARPMRYRLDTTVRRCAEPRAPRPPKNTKATKRAAVRTQTPEVVLDSGTCMEVIGQASSGMVVRLEDGRLLRATLTEL